MEQKNPHKAHYLWEQLYSSSGLKAARTACNAIQEKINFNVISMPLCAYQVGFILQFLPYVLWASSSRGSLVYLLLYQQVK